MEVIVIIVIVIVVLGIAGTVLGPIMAGSNGNKVGSAFAQAYREEFGVAPSAAAEKAISSGTAIILNAMGSGQYSYPSQNLRKAINDYGTAVSWDESKMELGLGCLLAICCTKKLDVSPGCQWAADVIMASMSDHCPSMMRRVFGM